MRINCDFFVKYASFPAIFGRKKCCGDTKNDFVKSNINSNFQRLQVENHGSDSANTQKQTNKVLKPEGSNLLFAVMNWRGMYQQMGDPTGFF